jgi:hypothetical protein
LPTRTTTCGDYFSNTIKYLGLGQFCNENSKKAAQWWFIRLYKVIVSSQIWLPSFRDSDGDGIGDIVGLTDRLEKLRKIGIQTVWPTPLFSSDNFSLVVRNHTEIDAQLGTNSQFDSLIAQVHAKGRSWFILHRSDHVVFHRNVSDH